MHNPLQQYQNIINSFSVQIRLFYNSIFLNKDCQFIIL